MRTVAYSQVLQKFCELGGQTYSTAPTEMLLRYRGFIDGRFSNAWESEWWPDLKVLEKRHLRPIYRSSAAYLTGDEIWWPQENKYYQALTATTGNAPTDSSGVVAEAYWATCGTSPSGGEWSSATSYVVGNTVSYEPTQSTYQCIVANSNTAPDSASGYTKWGQLRSFDRLLPEAQTESALSVSALTSTATAFTVTTAVNHDLERDDLVTLAGATPATYNGRWTVATVTSPKIFTIASTLNPGASSGTITATPYRRPLGDVQNVFDRNVRNLAYRTEYSKRLVNGGLQLTDATPGTFWLEQRVRRSVLTGDAYSATATYTGGSDQIQFTIGSTINFYNCLADTSAAQSPTTHPGKWELVTIPYIFLNYLTWGSYADALRMDGQSDKARVADAEAEGWLAHETQKLYGQQGQTERLKVQTY